MIFTLNGIPLDKSIVEPSGSNSQKDFFERKYRIEKEVH